MHTVTCVILLANFSRNAHNTESGVTATPKCHCHCILWFIRHSEVLMLHKMSHQYGVPSSAHNTKGATTTLDLSTTVTAFYGPSDTQSVDVTQDVTSGGVPTFPGHQAASPIRFHVHHGSSITLSADYSTATRSKNHWDYSICFSNRSLHVNERVALRIVNITKMLMIMVTLASPQSTQPPLILLHYQNTLIRI
jgi:hypothetical protein